MVRFARTEGKASPRFVKGPLKSAFKSAAIQSPLPHLQHGKTPLPTNQKSSKGVFKQLLTKSREDALEHGTPRFHKALFDPASFAKNASAERLQLDHDNETFHFSDDDDDDDDEYQVEETEDDDDMADWDETTLVAMLQEESSAQTYKMKMSALADSLQAPMAAQSSTVKDYLLTTLIPATKRVKEVHDAMEKNCDVPYAMGLLAFDEECKKFEALAIRDEEELRRAYTQNRMEELFGQLEEAYAKRDKLWDELEDAVQASVVRAKTALEALPEAIKTKAAVIEKKAKELEKSDSASAKERMLRDLFDKF